MPAIVGTLLLSVYPIMYFYSRNQWIYSLRSLAASVIMVCLAIGILFWLINRYFIKDSKKTALFLGLTVTLFFSFNILIGISKDLLGDHGHSSYISVATAILYAFIAYFIFKTNRNLNFFVKITNYTAIFLVILPLSSIFFHQYQIFSAKREVLSILPAQESGVAAKSTFRPNIYYIIVDAYASKDTINKYYGYDNSEIYDYLREKGFYIAEKSMSNYAHTIESLASTLNMDYLSNLFKGRDESIDLAPVIESVRNNYVTRFLKERGYAFINVSSGFELTAENNYADFDFSFANANSVWLKDDFASAFLYYYSALRPFYFDRGSGNIGYGDTNGVLYAFDKIGQISAEKFNKPIYVFAHVVSPHPVFRFDRECNILSKKEATGQDKTKGYINKIYCTNKLLKKTIDVILRNSSEPPIIIVQSDHGFNTSEEEEKAMTNKPVSEIPAEILQKELRNFEAYYLPNNGSAGFYPTITPVNVFRTIFNEYFGANFPILEDRAFRPIDDKFFYKMDEATAKVKY